MNVPLKKRYNYCTINNGNIGSVNLNGKPATSKCNYHCCARHHSLSISRRNQLHNFYLIHLHLFFIRAVNNATIYTEMLFKNRENNNENAEQTMRIDIGVAGGGIGSGGTVNKLDSDKKINAAICTLSTAIMPTAGSCALLTHGKLHLKLNIRQFVCCSERNSIGARSTALCSICWRCGRSDSTACITMLNR